MNPAYHTLRNRNGMEVDLLASGARIAAVRIPVEGRMLDMILGYDGIEEYETDPFYLGATVGRVCNRINNASFKLDGQTFTLSRNSGGHCLHGGENGFSARQWRFVEPTLSTTEAELALSSPSGDQGFPGRVCVRVRYVLDDDGRLTIEFEATSDAPTPINLCNHAYFHLGESAVADLSLQLFASRYLPVEGGIPQTRPQPVAGSPFDFTSPAWVGERLANLEHEQLASNSGFDHCYLLSAQHSVSARLRGRHHGIELEICTDQPGMQLYTGQYLEPPFRPYQALCLEAQNLPDAINRPDFPSSLLTPGDLYRRRVSYRFSRTRR